MITLVAKHGLPDERKPVDVRVAGIWIEDYAMPSEGVEEEAPQRVVASIEEVDTELDKINARIADALGDLVQYYLAKKQK